MAAVGLAALWLFAICTPPQVFFVGRLVVVAFVLTGCSHGKPSMSGDASKTLQAKVAEIRVSATTLDASAVAA